MTAREIFGLFLRTGAMTLIVLAFFDLEHVVAILLGLPLMSQYSSSRDAMTAGFYFLPGTLLLACAPLLMRLTYGPKS
jgi:hypothetical protein